MLRSADQVRNYLSETASTTHPRDWKRVQHGCEFQEQIGRREGTAGLCQSPVMAWYLGANPG